MKRAQLVGFGIAGVAGVLTLFLASGISPKKQQTTTTREVEIDTVEVLVAAKDIGLGQIVNEQHFTWTKWPQKGLNPGLITSARKNAKSELAGSIARAPMIAGEPATAQKLIKPGQGGVLAAILPSGMRAISTEVNMEASAGGLILPNDHVDVILIRSERKRAGGEEFFADTLFRNVRVLAMGQQLEAEPGTKSTRTSGSTTSTLELTPTQAETLAMANSMGTIALSLRSVADIDSEGRHLDGQDISTERGNSIGVTRYGVKSRAYGVN